MSYTLDVLTSLGPKQVRRCATLEFQVIRETGRIAINVDRRLVMRGLGLQLALSAAVLTMACAGLVRAAENTGSPRGLQAKIQYCTSCHQPSGEGYRGSSPIPRLAGQQTEYFENQLKAFIERRRTDKFMFKVAHSLNPAMLSALAEHFNGLNPKPLGGAPKDLVPAGKKIFEEGIPEANVPPCASCHGPEAKGNGAFPRLAGQVYPYLIKVLSNWDKERGQDPAHPDTSAIMQPIAHSLTAQQISAVATYLSGLE
ncbi:c-type cytochrome [Hyphomicrobium sp.]|uniref:c-type cytochrome n=1 Tax=Hyphomicrobium sp. TaxID=82 RepID=UPI0025B9BCC9|nr:c-type cytochrome [Hyphomicrobium sp.]